MTTDKPICDDCGKVHVTWRGTPACKAHLSGSGKTQPCSRSPIKGALVCRTHGGALQRTKQAAAERLALMSAMGEIGDLMRECDIPDQHPADGLLEVVRVAGSMMRLLTVKVGELEEEPKIREVLIEGKDGTLATKEVSTRHAFWGLDKDGQMEPHVYVTMLRQWTERYERACKTALDAGIEERKLRLAEDTSDMLYSALSRAVASLGLDEAMRSALNLALATELRKTQALEANVTEVQ